MLIPATERTMIKRSSQESRKTAESIARTMPVRSSPKKIGSIRKSEVHMPSQRTSRIGVRVRSVSPKLKKLT